MVSVSPLHHIQRRIWYSKKSIIKTCLTVVKGSYIGWLDYLQLQTHNAHLYHLGATEEKHFEPHA
ncbi:hypothetical protein HanXRQr2_Chr16g0731271 [Helianthus annuus]|uniref:Uncharacterized protein n=1 Tax=Helianthus annuus TaxID=4232 RepID=A0A9K3GYV1_HELAN|nr:hypothetical protein HanXRQr2_Chr16g0731271 [Helianthus annuus]